MFLLYVCLNKDEKSIQVVIFIFFFRFVSFLVRLCMGLRFFLFCSWFFGLARGLYLCLVILSMVEGRGLASVAKVRGVTLGRSQICDRTSFRIPRLK